MLEVVREFVPAMFLQRRCDQPRPVRGIARTSFPLSGLWYSNLWQPGYPDLVASLSGSVTCPVHGSMFWMTDGRVVRGPASRAQPVYEVRVNDGAIEVRAPR